MGFTLWIILINSLISRILRSLSKKYDIGQLSSKGDFRAKTALWIKGSFDFFPSSLLPELGGKDARYLDGCQNWISLRKSY